MPSRKRKLSATAPSASSDATGARSEASSVDRTHLGSGDEQGSAQPEEPLEEDVGRGSISDHLHGDIAHAVCMFVEAPCLGTLAAASRGLVSSDSWQCRAEQLWPSLAKSGPAGARIYKRTAPVALFRALHAGFKGSSHVDEAAAERLNRVLVLPYTTPVENSVLLTIFHGPEAVGRGSSTISRIWTSSKGENAQFQLSIGSYLEKTVDQWFDSFVVDVRSRQPLVNCEIKEPDLLAELRLFVALEVWTWPHGPKGTPHVVCPHMPLTVVVRDEDDNIFFLHFLHFPFQGSDENDCLHLVIKIERSVLRPQKLAVASANLRGRVGANLSNSKRMFWHFGHCSNCGFACLVFVVRFEIYVLSS
jgi:hypothetical protein